MFSTARGAARLLPLGGRRHSAAPAGLLAIAGALLAAGCGEAAAPLLDVTPAYSGVEGTRFVWTGMCPVPADVVVSDEDELLDALASADAGDVIGIDGMIEMENEPVVIETDGLTLTCATPHSGVFFGADNPGNDLVFVTAADVTVSHLVLDGSGGLRPIRAVNNGADREANATKILNNEVRCGQGSCAFLAGVAGAEVRNNWFTAGESLATGVHLQGQGPFNPDGTRVRPIDGSRVEENLIVSEMGSTNQGFGGIRIRDGRDVSVSYNEVYGPWQNAVSVNRLRDSYVKYNVLTGAQQIGVAVELGAYVLGAFRGNYVSHNTISYAAENGILVGGGCFNYFENNALVGNGPGGVVGISLGVETGANTYVGDPGLVDFDGPDWDCDGDGVVDVNIIIPG